MEQVQTLNPNHHWGSLSLVLTDHAGIAAVHADFLGEHRSTDVISFAYPAQPPAQPQACGEVIVNTAQAQEQGPRYGGIARELALYIAHGCHHLSGADDHTPAQRAAMRRIENRWLRRAHAADLLAPLLTLDAPEHP